MSVPVIRTAEARADLRRILAYFLDQNEPAVAARFLAAHEESLTLIGQSPELGSPWASDEKYLSNLRVKPIRGFEKYLVFFRLSAQCVYIVRVFHGHQDIENLL